MHIDQLFPSRFLRCSDLNGKPLRVTISGLARESIGDEQKAVLTFSDGAKQLILNKTNARSIAKILGEETSRWIGREIILVPTIVDFKGDSVDAIRVRAAPARSAAAVPDDDEPAFPDDDFRI